jgi:putative MFS transporter
MATGAIGAVVLMILRHSTPESPHWLRSRGREAEAQAAWRYATGAPEPPRDVAPPPVAVAPARYASIRRLFRRPLIALTICLCVYWGCNNLYGSAILLYQPTLLTRIVEPSTFTALTFTALTSTLSAISGLLICLFVIERIGRRVVALGCTSIVVLAMAILWIGYHQAGVVLVAFALTLVFINGGSSMAYYAWAPELFPTAVRGRAIGVVNMVGKLGSVVGTFALPSVFDAWGSGAFLLIGAIALVNVVVTAVLSVETKGRTLDEVQTVARQRYGGAAEPAVAEV